jgi:hypothetical protein
VEIESTLYYLYEGIYLKVGMVQITMRSIKSAAIIILIGTLSCCDILIAPKQGRWNYNDPKAELEPFNQYLEPVEDGYVDSGGSWDDTSVEFKVRDDRYALLKFNITDVPDIISIGMLQLYCTGGGGDSNISLHKILQPWDPGSVDWTEVVNPGFFDPNPLAITYVTTTSLTYSWSLKDQVASLQHGLVLIADDGDERRFASKEEPTDPKPILVIEGFNKL